tara:strand:- start:1780 stop:2028 length:249 start_codon:yes stop_codon:yes gene_type:complete
MTKEEFVKVLVDLAQGMEIKDNIDFGMLRIKESEAYELMATTVVEQFYNVPAEQKEIVMLASLVKLLVENFVLNARLQGAEK